jgi:hypothetical protein
MHLLKPQLIFGVELISAKAESGTMALAMATMISLSMNNLLLFNSGPASVSTSANEIFDTTTVQHLLKSDVQTDIDACFTKHRAGKLGCERQ